ncbi:hypothetical protein TrVFT333_009706 [Trichoderma virens FT-333]|nr:hypothetical protein TrVFT333_009706 [Trichoderma virens FT-333]
MSIRPLPEDVVGKIRSSSTITSLNGAVCGLLKNSLDAGATKVNIHVEYGRGNCIVEDDGLGIVPGDFAEDGGLGKPYYRPGLDKEWGRLVHDVVGLLVSWPSGVTVSLRETKGQRELRLKPPDNADMVSRALRFFTQASLADSGDVDSWVPVSATAGHITIKGCISLNPVATRRSQFMSVGILPVSNEYGSNVLYEEVNKMFASSDFGVIEHKGGMSNDGTGPNQKKSKGADRWPMFYLRITLKGAEDVFDVDDISSHSHGDLERILDSPFDGWNRMKVGPRTERRPAKRVLRKHETRPSTSETIVTNRLIGEGGRLLRKPFDVSAPLSPGKGGKRVDAESQDESETNPLTLAERPKRVAEDLSSEKAKRLKVSGSGSRDGELMGRKEASEEKEPREWLQNILKSWKNPVFEPTQAGVPRINDEAPAPHAADERCRLEELMAGYFKQDGSHKFPRAVVEPLERPLIFEISDREYDLLQRYQEHLEAWGILYKIQRRAASTKQEQDGCTVAVSALPPSILERCRTEPRLLVELMRKEIWKLDDEGIMPPRPRSAGRTGEQTQSSTADFHGCPRGILELLHSRACRSAIMFNDALSAEECELLVQRLARKFKKYME